MLCLLPTSVKTLKNCHRRLSEAARAREERALPKAPDRGPAGYMPPSRPTRWCIGPSNDITAGPETTFLSLAGEVTNQKSAAGFRTSLTGPPNDGGRDARTTFFTVLITDEGPQHQMPSNHIVMPHIGGTVSEERTAMVHIYGVTARTEVRAIGWQTRDSHPASHIPSHPLASHYSPEQRLSTCLREVAYFRELFGLHDPVFFLTGPRCRV